MNFQLRIWRQKNLHLPGKLADYKVNNISPDTSFLEMLDILNEDLLQAGENPSRSTPIVAKGFAAPARSP